MTSRARGPPQTQGGDQSVARQHDRGRLTIRERIDALLDAGSFREIGSLAGSAERDETGGLVAFTPANFVLGTGRIDGRTCVVGGEDFTISAALLLPPDCAKASIRRNSPATTASRWSGCTRAPAAA